MSPARDRADGPGAVATTLVTVRPQQAESERQSLKRAT